MNDQESSRSWREYWKNEIEQLEEYRRLRGLQERGGACSDDEQEAFEKLDWLYRVFSDTELDRLLMLLQEKWEADVAPEHGRMDRLDRRRSRRRMS